METRLWSFLVNGEHVWGFPVQALGCHSQPWCDCQLCLTLKNGQELSCDGLASCNSCLWWRRWGW